MPGLINWDPNTFLVSGISAQVTGAMIDTRAAKNYGYLVYTCSGTGAESAIFSLQASHNVTGWMTVATYTATATQTGTAQIAGYFPYMRVNISKVYSGTGGADNGKGTLWVHYSPGMG